MSSNTQLDPKLHSPEENGRNWYFCAADAQKLWIVKSGKVDVFLQEIKGDQLGARFHLLRVEEGEVIFGLHLSRDTRLVLVASLHPGTLLSAMDLASFRRPGGFPRMPLVYEWIHKLYSAFTKTMIPKEYKGVKSGDEISTGEQGLAVAPDSEIVWVKHLAGKSRFCGTGVFITEPAYLPLSKPGGGWLELAENS